MSIFEGEAILKQSFPVERIERGEGSMEGGEVVRAEGRGTG